MFRNTENNMKQKALLILLYLLFVSAIGFSGTKNNTIVNLSHLNHLYEQVKINGTEMGMIHIYANLPDYKWVEAEGEGITCIDDCVRAAFVYMNDYTKTKNEDSYKKSKELIRLVIYLQSSNGFFYNFLNKDLSINKTYRTSIDEPNWWSWRALWGLAHSYNFFIKKDKKFANEIKPALDKGINATLNWIGKKDTSVEINGIMLPVCLPSGTAADQSAVILKTLVQYYRINKNPDIKKTIIRLSDAIIKMQAGSANKFPYFALLSWETSWHAWGNNQAEALIQASELLGDKKYLNAALNEINCFYPYLIKEKYISEFEIEKKDGVIKTKRNSKFTQIAYGISPMVLACINAARVEKNVKYANMAAEIGEWFFGKNASAKVMYDVNTGRCYDGINDSVSVNYNSGAESTIEALLAMQALESNKTSLDIIEKYIKQK
jgi:hypothetical protein